MMESGWFGVLADFGDGGLGNPGDEAQPAMKAMLAASITQRWRIFTVAR
jgi:hypothetical protein